jgi:hypothetical protein
MNRSQNASNGGGILGRKTMFRIGQNGQEPIVDVDSIERIGPAIRSTKPGRYHIDEISADTLHSGHTPRRWGVGIKRADGSVAIERDSWEA